MSETLITVDAVSKRFCRNLKRSLWYGLQDLGNEFRGHRHAIPGGALRPDEFWALRDVSFELKRGQCLGLIGRNGAGKTTLLRMLNGLIKPDAGRIEMRGRIGALIALGAGFNPVLTGRENIYVNAAVLGMGKREIARKLDDIIAFAEIDGFIDTPVQSYSSGMTVRLGFAIASQLEPDILLIDEVLAVGDAQFHAKCLNAIANLLRQSAVILVSHSMAQIAKACSQAIHLRAGSATFGPGIVQTAIAHYQQGVVQGPLRHVAVAGVWLREILFNSRSTPDAPEQRLRFEIDDDREDVQERTVILDNRDCFALEIVAVIPEVYEIFFLQLTIEDAEQRMAMQITSGLLSRPLESPQVLVFKAELNALPLNSGYYLLHCEIRTGDGSRGLAETLIWAQNVVRIHMTGRLFPGASSVQLEADWRCEY